MKRAHSTKKIGLSVLSLLGRQSAPRGYIRSTVMSSATISNIATTASNGAASSRNAAPHRKNAAQRNQSDSPYQQRTTQSENPTQQLIKQAVDYLIEQLNAGHSDMLAAYLRTMARFHNYSLATSCKSLASGLRQLMSRDSGNGRNWAVSSKKAKKAFRFSLRLPATAAGKTKRSRRQKRNPCAS
jgi:hypothetical protein